ELTLLNAASRRPARRRVFHSLMTRFFSRSGDRNPAPGQRVYLPSVITGDSYDCHHPDGVRVARASGDARYFIGRNVDQADRRRRSTCDANVFWGASWGDIPRAAAYRARRDAGGGSLERRFSRRLAPSGVVRGACFGFDLAARDRPPQGALGPALSDRRGIGRTDRIHYR